MLPSLSRVVAVCDSDPDTTELLKTVLEMNGMSVAIGNLLNFRLGKENLLEFLRAVSPDVIVYDLGIPYVANYQFLQAARQNPAFPRCGLVITSTNAAAVQSLVGVQAIEIVGKPYDLDVLVQAVRASGGDGQVVFPPAAPDAERRVAERRHADRRAGSDRRAGESGVH